jgi:tetratricopeptide (TPR) repeat protein
MEAARERGIPTAFVVGKTGKIEWIGHPSQIDEPLQQVVASTWDRDAFGRGYRLVQELNVMYEQALLAADEGDVERAREITASMMHASELADRKSTAAWMVRRVERKIFNGYLVNDQDKAAEQLPRIVELLDGDAQAINQVTWGIVKIAEAGKPVSDKLLQLSADITNAALSPTEPEGSLLDTIAHCYYHLGDLDRAIAYQQRAVKGGNEGQLQQEIEDYLAKLLSEKQQADPPKTKPNGYSYLKGRYVGDIWCSEAPETQLIA